MKKNSNNIKIVSRWQCVISLVVGLFAMVLLNSCTNNNGLEEELDKLPEGVVCIDLMVDNIRTLSRANAGTPDERAIDGVHLFFYSEDKLAALFSTETAGVSFVNNRITLPIGAIDPTKVYNIFVVANWKSFNSAEFPFGSDRSLLTSTLIDDPTQIVPHDNPLRLHMSGEILSHRFKDSPLVEINLIRQAVRFDIKVVLGREFSSLYDKVYQFGGNAGDVQVGLSGVPFTSFLIQQPKPTLPPPSIEFEYPYSILDSEWKRTIYSFENPVSGDGNEAIKKSTFIVLQLPYKKLSDNTIVTENYYTIYINDKNNPVNPHQTLRNNIYRVTMTVNGFGEPSPNYDLPPKVNTSFEVTPWIDGGYDDEIGGATLKLSSVRVRLYDNDDSELICTTDSEKDITVTATQLEGSIRFTQSRQGKVTTLKIRTLNNINGPSSANFASLTIKYKNIVRKVKVFYTNSN